MVLIVPSVLLVGRRKSRHHRVQLALLRHRSMGIAKDRRRMMRDSRGHIHGARPKGRMHVEARFAVGGIDVMS
jgi:hypothetical protein